MILVDTNVLLDLLADDRVGRLARLEEAALAGPVLINDIVYADQYLLEPLSSASRSPAMLADAMIEIAPTPRPALFLAGKAFQHYRAARGMRTGVLPDFFIGAHAAVNPGRMAAVDARRAPLSRLFFRRSR